MKKLLTFCLFALAPFALAQFSPATAQVKIAVIDLGKAFDEYSVTKDARARLNAKHDQYQKELQDMISDYDHKGQEAQKLQQAVNDPTMATATLPERQKAFDQAKQELFTLKGKLEDRKSELDKELNDEMYRRHKEIIEEITKVVDDYSGPQGYDLVIDISSVQSSGVSLVLYRSSKLTDITADIIKQLNASAPPSTAPATPVAPSGANH